MSVTLQTEPTINPQHVNMEVDFKLTTKAFKNIYSITKTDAIPHIEKHMLTYAINTKQRMAVFLAACFLQSAGFRRSTESFNLTPCRLYKENERVESYELAKRLTRIGEKEVANFLYSFKDGNGGIDSNDGWNFRCRTPLQFRGRDNYQAVAELSGLDCIVNPDILDDEENSVIAAMAYWQLNDYNKLADKLIFDDSGELVVSLHKTTKTKNYRSNRGAVYIKKKISNDTTQLIDFCGFIERAMRYL